MADVAQVRDDVLTEQHVTADSLSDYVAGKSAGDPAYRLVTELQRERRPNVEH